MSGKDLTAREEKGRVKEQGRAGVCQKGEVVEERFKEVGEELNKSRTAVCYSNFKQTGDS